MEEIKGQLLGSLFLFTQFFFEKRTGQPYRVSRPIGRPSHQKIIAQNLTKVIDGDLTKLIIEIPPRYGKTELLINFVAWGLARYPDSNFIYVSANKELAVKSTQAIREIVSLPVYRHLFDVNISADSRAKSYFKTTHNGAVMGVGARGTITGSGGGLQRGDRFGGCIVIDDVLKPAQVTSDTVREEVNDWYHRTLQSRRNSTRYTPIIFCAQSLGQNDLGDTLSKIKDKDGNKEWYRVSIPVLDEAGNALDPFLATVDDLLQLKRESPYWFKTQYQQQRVSMENAIFDPSNIVTVSKEPDLLATFLTVDTAETEKTYNDATVFSFWGVYEGGADRFASGIHYLHWLDCYQCWVKPSDLQEEFLEFYRQCMRHKVRPSFAAIEKKSTGTTLISLLKRLPNMSIFDIERTAASASKINRFIDIQSYINTQRVTLPFQANHAHLVRTHLRQITLQGKAKDDIADTLADAVKLALIDNVIVLNDNKNQEESIVSQHFSRAFAERKKAFEK